MDTVVPRLVQALLEKSVYTTVPPGLEPPVRDEVSWTLVPLIMLVTDASVEFRMAVVIVGENLLIIIVTVAVWNSDPLVPVTVSV